MKSIAQRNSIRIVNLVLILFLLVCAVPGSRAQAGVTAEFDPFAAGGDWFRRPFYENYYVGQTFLATETRTLKSVEATIHRLALDQDPDNPQDPVALTMELYALSGSGVPTGSALASGVLAYEDPQFDTFLITFKTIEMSAVELVAGESYAIVANALLSVKLYDWYSKYGDDFYPDGRLITNSGGGWAKQGYDLGFRVNVDPTTPSVPAPGALALGLLGLGIVRRRRLR